MNILFSIITWVWLNEAGEFQHSPSKGSPSAIAVENFDASQQHAIVKNQLVTVKQAEAVVVTDRLTEDAGCYSAEWDLIATLFKYSTADTANLVPTGDALTNYYLLVNYANAITDAGVKAGVLADAQRMSFVWSWLNRTYAQRNWPAYAFTGARYLTNIVQQTIYEPVTP